MGSEPASSAPGAAAAEGPAARATGSGSRRVSSGQGAAVGSGVPGTATSVSTPSRWVAAKSPGITRSTIYVGVAYSSQAGAGDRAIGAAGAAPSYDTRDVYNVIIDYANKHGGFAGRRMKALYYDYNTTTDTNTQDQSACAYWTQDNKVFAMRGVTNILNACAEKAGAIPFGAGSAVAATYRKFPHLIDPDAIRLDRLGQVTTVGLYRAGYFTGKLGIVTWDDPNYKAAIKQGYLPTMSTVHVTPAQIVYISVPQQLGALGDTTAAVQSAVTKFKSLGIDHVIVQDGQAGVFGGGGLTLEWMDQAKSQQYYPRYGQNVYNGPGSPILPSDQMDHAIAIDQTDNDQKYDEGWHANGARDNCYKIEAEAGFPVSSSNSGDELVAGSACDFVFFVQSLVNSVSSISNDSFIDAAGRLGTSFASSLVYGTKLVPGRRDGGDMVRTEEYFASCSCLKYKGAPYYAD